MTEHSADQQQAARQAAGRLLAAARDRVPCAPVRDLLKTADMAGAMAAGYAVQRMLTEHALAGGRRITGRKVGLTSEAVQRQLGVDQPDFGVLFADMERSQDELIDMADLLQPRIEAEVAFVLRSELDPGHLSSPGLDLAGVRAAVACAVAAFEIVDSRVAGWDISLTDTVADNASSGLYVLGSGYRRLDGLDLPGIPMTMTADGEPVSSGTGAACLGDPLLALLWLARTARDYGDPLRPGDLVLSGALGPMVPVRPGTTYVAELGGLGTVRAEFGEQKEGRL
jgi:2-keto-4-pentenoate hydratase